MRTPGLFALMAKCKCVPWIRGGRGGCCEGAPLNATPSYLKSSPARGAAVGGSIASFLCTQTSRRSGRPGRERKADAWVPRATGCHGWLRSIPDKHCVTVLLHSCGESLLGAGAKSTVYRGEGTKNTRGLQRTSGYGDLTPAGCVSTGCRKAGTHPGLATCPARNGT